MKHKQQYRQGDVLIERIVKIPPSAQRQDAKVIVLAHGEATGHAHTIKDRDSADWWKTESEHFLEIAAGAEVVHQEHGTIHIPKGRYRVSRQREYSPTAIRNVAD